MRGAPHARRRHLANRRERAKKAPGPKAASPAAIVRVSAAGAWSGRNGAKRLRLLGTLGVHAEVTDDLMLGGMLWHDAGAGPIFGSQIDRTIWRRSAGYCSKAERTEGIRMPRKKKKKPPIKRSKNRPVKGRLPEQAIEQEDDLDLVVIKLLEYFSCPCPFHQVRAGFMGNVASPDLNVKPLGEVERAWNGALPDFRNDEEMNAFMQILVMGFYNKMCSHQDRDNPFKLVKLEPIFLGNECVMLFGSARSEEIDGFVGGLFGGQKDIALPTIAREAIESLLEKRESFAAAAEIASDPSEQSDEASIKRTLEKFQEMTRVAEEEINVVIQSCKEARAKAVDMMFKDRP